VNQGQYRAALAAARREYDELTANRRDIDDRLAQLSQTIGTLSQLLGVTPTVAVGLTDACRLVIRGAAGPLNAPEVRDRLAAIGIDLSIYTNELSAIHTILKRLSGSGAIRRMPWSATGKPAYVWNHAATQSATRAGTAEARQPSGALPSARRRPRKD
jgi:hypothetical protein